MQGQLLDVRKQLNQLQQKLIERDISNSDSTRAQTAKETNQYNDLFSRLTLQRGDQSQAVKDLQIALNSVPNLVVAESGPGSIGQETRYFGAKTYQAVVAFQNRYKGSILQPLGLRKPTGVVGAQTKDKLRELIRSEKLIASGSRESLSEDGRSNNDQSSNSNTPDANTSSEPESLSELQNRFTLDKWSFTQEEKQTIYDMMPPGIQDEYYSDFVRGSQPSNADDSIDNEPSTSPLQERYQEIQESNETSLKEWLEGHLALQTLQRPLGLLQRQMNQIFGPQTAHAQGPLIFGGRIASVEPCPVPPNALQVTVAGPRPGRFAFIPGATQLRPAYAVVPKPGVSTLGSYAPVPGCYTPPTPVPVPLTQGTIVLMGVAI